LQDLEIIRNARADIRSALDANPQDPLLHELLADTWQQEMDFYTNVSSTTDSARRRWPL
jgi:Tfp pilus assembly protein PilF